MSDKGNLEKTLMKLILCGIVIFNSCYKEITLQKCSKPSVCNNGIYNCKDGYCVDNDRGCNFDDLNDSSDGCCLFFLTDRLDDSDCNLFSVQLDGADPSYPAVDDAGNVFYSFFSTSQTEGENSVVTVSLDRWGNKRWAHTIGKSKFLIPPLISDSGNIYAAFSDGVRILDQNSGDELNIIPKTVFVKNLVQTESGKIVYISLTGNFVIYDEATDFVMEAFSSDKQEQGVTSSDTEFNYGMPVYIKNPGSVISVDTSGTVRALFLESPGLYFSFDTGLKNSACPLLPNSEKGQFYLLSPQDFENNPQRSNEVYYAIHTFSIKDKNLSEVWFFELKEPYKKGEYPSCPVFDRKGNIVIVTKENKVIFLKDSGNDFVPVSILSLNLPDSCQAKHILISGDDVLFVPCKNKGLYTFSITYDGDKIVVKPGWRFEVENMQNSGVTVDPFGNVIFSTITGKTFSKRGSFSSVMWKWGKVYSNIYNSGN